MLVDGTMEDGVNEKVDVEVPCAIPDHQRGIHGSGSDRGEGRMVQKPTGRWPKPDTMESNAAKVY